MRLTQSSLTSLCHPNQYLLPKVWSERSNLYFSPHISASKMMMILLQQSVCQSNQSPEYGASKVWSWAEMMSKDRRHAKHGYPNTYQCCWSPLNAQTTRNSILCRPLLQLWRHDLQFGFSSAVFLLNLMVVCWKSTAVSLLHGFKLLNGPVFFSPVKRESFWVLM